MSYEITIPEQKYTLIRKPDSQEYVILDSDGDEVTGVIDLHEGDTPEGGAESLVDKLLSDVVPDRVGIDVGDLQGEIAVFMSEQSQ